jgi:LacI family transcriptional regulator
VKRKVTITSIAKAAGVSAPTVSRALNDKPDVDEATRARVLKIAGELGYFPSRSARALRTGRFETVGLLVTSFGVSWMSEVVRGVAEEAQALGYNLILHLLVAGEDAERHFVEDIMPSQPVDGLVLIMPDGMLPFVGQLADHGLPVVVVDDVVRRPDLPSIEVDNRGGALEAVNHLIGLGMHDIAIITGPLDRVYSQERLEGYKSALADAGLSYRPDLVVVGDGWAPSGAEAADKLLSSGASFDALFAFTDEMALGALSSLHRAGVRVPEDVALVGFDDVPAAVLSIPSLTTVHQYLYELGRVSLQTLVDLLNGLKVAPRTVLPTSLIVRESSAVTVKPGVSHGS